jgi:hypothetical protein
MEKSLFASSIASTIEVIASHPIDVFKTRRQYNPTFGIKDFLKLSFKDQYRGIVPRLIGVSPMRMTFWPCINYANSNIQHKHKYLLAGMFGGFMQTFIDTPIEYTKIQSIYKNKIHLRRLYNGYLPNCLRNMVFAISLNMCNHCDDLPDNKFIRGGIGGFLGSVISQPLDYWKTQRQINPDYTFKTSCLKNIMKGGASRAFMGFINMGIGSLVFYTLISKLNDA